MSECVFGTCKHIADLEEEVRVCNEARIQAEHDMFQALDHDEAVATLRRELHKQDDIVQAARRLLEAWDAKRPLAWQPENNPALLDALRAAFRSANVTAHLRAAKGEPQ